MKKYVSESGRIELFTHDSIRPHSIYLDGDLVGSVTFSADSVSFNFDEDWLFKENTIREILKTVEQAKKEMIETNTHIKTLKNHKELLIGKLKGDAPVCADVADSISWALEKLNKL